MQTTIPAKLNARRYDLDWLKAMAVLLVPIMHAAIIFSNTPYLIKNPLTSLAVDIPVLLIGLPLMPLLFTISGMSMRYALGSKGPKEFLRSRFPRLLVPFLFGLFTISSVSTYYATRYSGKFSGSFLDFYPNYFDGWWGYGGNFPWYGHHLYFLLYLFVFSIVGLGLFRLLRSDANRKSIAALAGFANKPGGLYLLILPVLVIEYTNPLGRFGIPHQGGWHMFSLVWFLILGYLIASNEGFQRAIHRHVRYAPGVVILAVGAAALAYLPNEDMYLALVPISIYSWSIAILLLSHASKRWNKPNKALALLGDSALPFYIVHEGILVSVAYYVCITDLGIFTKFVIILAVSVPLMVLAVALIRSVNILRFLFGLRQRRNAMRISAAD
jgi:peptidoglycan/LPS O-acetylase OafA/YrhL